MKWVDDPNSLLQKRLNIADMTFAEAAEQLQQLPKARSPSLDALASRLEGMLIYRQWMIDAHRRTKSGMTTVAMGNEAELAELKKAADKYAAAEAKAPGSAIDLMDWGNILRASGKFDDAIVRIPARHRSRSVERRPGTEHRHRLHRPLRTQCRDARRRPPAGGAGLTRGLSGLAVRRRPVRLAASQGAAAACRCRSRPGLRGMPEDDAQDAAIGPRPRSANGRTPRPSSSASMVRSTASSRAAFAAPTSRGRHDKAASPATHWPFMVHDGSASRISPSACASGGTCCSVARPGRPGRACSCASVRDCRD